MNRLISNNVVNVHQRLKQLSVLQVDARPAALFRILLGLLLLKDAIYRLWIVTPFYSDDGIVPRSVIAEIGRVTRWSFMDALGADWQVTLFLWLWIVVLIAMIVGYHTRIMTVLNFILLVSLHERNVYILTGADTALRVFSFWLIWIECGRVYSLDTRQTRGTIAAFPVWALRIQVSLIYFTTAYLKWLGEPWRQGEALHYVLQLETILLPPGALLREIAPETLLRALSHAALLIETLLPIFLLMPMRWRWIGIGLGVSLHLGIALTLAIPDFSWVMILSYVIMLRGDPIPMTTQPSSRFNPLYLGLIPFLLIVLWWNIDQLGRYDSRPYPPIPPAIADVVEYLGIWQFWDLYAPIPYQVDGRMTVIGTFENGYQVDLLREPPPTMPPDGVLWGPLMRWKKFEEVLFNNQHQPILRAWAAYYCTHHNRDYTAGSYLATVEINFVFRRSHPPGHPRYAQQIVTLWRHDCLA
jgi:hypothetical protein